MEIQETAIRPVDGRGNRGSYPKSASYRNKDSQKKDVR